MDKEKMLMEKNKLRLKRINAVNSELYNLNIGMAIPLSASKADVSMPLM